MLDFSSGHSLGITRLSPCRARCRMRSLTGVPRLLLPTHLPRSHALTLPLKKNQKGTF